MIGGQEFLCFQCCHASHAGRCYGLAVYIIGNVSGGEYADPADPYAMEPPAGKTWVRPAPHVMLVAPGGFDTADFTADYSAGGPWIAWEGTPYEFLIIPLQ